MNNDKKAQSSGGVGFIGLLTLVFITLKLIGVIDWSWVWVLAPIWITAAIMFFVIIIIFFHFLIKSEKR